MGVIKLPATVFVYKYIGATGSQTQINITGVNQRMTTADENASGSPATNPIPVPAAGNINSSYWQNTTLFAFTSPATSINNVKWYTGGSNPFPAGTFFSGSHTGSYIQAYGTPGTTGIQMASAAIPWAPGQMNSMFGFTSGAPLSLTGSISNPTTGLFTEWVTYQAYISSTAAAGQSSQTTFTFIYDEQ